MVGVGRLCYGCAKEFPPNAAFRHSSFVYIGRHYVSRVFSFFSFASNTSSVALSGDALNDFTRSSVPFEYVDTVFRMELVFDCKYSHRLLAARTTDTVTLATCERACQAICSLACYFAKWVLGRAASQVADAFLQLERVGLVRGGKLVDLI
jgi:hypothetical protein